MRGSPRRSDAAAILPDDVPVEMPELPMTLRITTEQQFKAVADPVRSRILGIIQNQPATAKQIADRLGIAPGTIGHHLQVLEAAGLAQIVARRQVRGTVAKYYTRTARIFNFDMAREITGSAAPAIELDILGRARDELAEALDTTVKPGSCSVAFPHARLSPARARVYAERLEAMLDDLLYEPPDPNGQVYGLCYAMFVAPAYLQGDGKPPAPAPHFPVDE
jgi:DNA-binding transcriptional ArsR family regulator